MSTKGTRRNKKTVNTKAANLTSPSNPETATVKTSRKKARASRLNGKLGGRPTTRKEPAKNKQFLITLGAIEYVNLQVENGVASNGSEFIETLIANHKAANTKKAKAAKAKK